MKIQLNSFVTKGLVCCAIAAAFGSCRFEDEDYFDVPAAQRSEQTSEKIQKILTEAPNGWLMQYFTGTNVAHFEGFNILAKFYGNGKVLLAGDHRMLRDGHAGQYTEYESLYDLLLEDGPVLAFNTWNDVLTPLVDPVSPWRAPTTIVKNGEGMGGDQNLVVTNYSEEELMMRGERHSGKVRFIPVEGDWEEYLASIRNTKNYITSADVNQYIVTDGTDTLYFSGVNEGRIRYCERLEDPLKYDTLSCVFTPTGMRFKDEVTFGTHKFQELNISADSLCLTTADDSVRVYAIWQPYFYGLLSRNVNDGMLALDYESLSAEQKSYYDTIDSEITAANKNYSLKCIGLGRSTSGGNVAGIVVVYYTDKNRTKQQNGALSMDYQVDEDYSVNIAFDASTANSTNNMKNLCRRANFKAAIEQLAASMVGVYKVTPNSYFVPNEGTFTSSDGSHSFKLKTEI